MELENGLASAFAEYNSFSISGEEDNYRIQVHGYSGTAGTCKHTAAACSEDMTYKRFSSIQKYVSDKLAIKLFKKDRTHINKIT